MTTGVVTLRAGGALARVSPMLGGRVLTASLIDAQGRPQAVLKPYPEDQTDLDDWGKGGIYPLVPYNGRLRDAVIHHAGERRPLAPHAGSAHTLHGPAQRRPWALLSQTADSAVMQHRHAPDAHWPWAYEATQTVRLTAGALVVALTLRNTDARPAPGGIGFHPYLPTGAAPELRYAASAPWPFDGDYLSATEGPDSDALTPHTIAAGSLLAGEVTRFHARWSGEALLTEGTSSANPALQLLAEGDLQALVLHRPVGAAHVCVEPVSHLPDAFNLGPTGEARLGARALAHGAVLHGVMTLRLA